MDDCAVGSDVLRAEAWREHSRGDGERGSHAMFSLNQVQVLKRGPATERPVQSTGLRHEFEQVAVDLVLFGRADAVGSEPSVRGYVGNQTNPGRLAAWTNRAGGTMPSKFEEYQQRAAECLRLAQAITDPKNKALLLDMAQAWIRLAEQAKAKAKGE
jgi:hypothetical protein